MCSFMVTSIACDVRSAVRNFRAHKNILISSKLVLLRIAPSASADVSSCLFADDVLVFTNSLF